VRLIFTQQVTTYTTILRILNTTLGIQDSRPRLTLSNGSRCKSKSGDNQIRASTVIEFVCDTSVFGSGTPRLTAQLPPGDDEDACAFVIEWRTHVSTFLVYISSVSHGSTPRSPAQPMNPAVHGVSLASSLSCTSALLPFLFRTLKLTKHSTISIIILYMVFGTLYNRYVLRLRGFDQIPQFSLASMKYHAHEALDWLKDIASGMREGGRSMGSNSGFFPHSDLSSAAGFGGGGEFPRTDTTPVSHQSQQPTHGRTGSGGGGGFMRPQTRTSSNGKRGEINPVSHQAQSQMERGESSSPPSLPPLPVKEKPRPKPFELETTGSTREEREFMLGDDEAEEGDDVGVALRRPMPPTQQVGPVVASSSAAGD